jgi:hypothetical protein
MDTKTLVVGQDVHIECGFCIYKVKVVKATLLGVEVQTDGGGRLRFDNNGKGYYMEDTYDCPGPWYLKEEARG